MGQVNQIDSFSIFTREEIFFLQKGLIQEIIAEEELSRVQLSALAAKRRDRYSMKPGGIEHDNKPHDQMFTSRDIRPGARNEYGLPPGEFPPGVRGQDGAAELNVNTTNGVQEINKERLGLQEDTVLQNNEGLCIVKYYYLKFVARFVNLFLIGLTYYSILV